MEMTFTEREMLRLCELLERSDPTNDGYYRILAAIRGLAEHSGIIEQLMPRVAEMQKPINETVVINEPVNNDTPPIDTSYAIPDETPFPIDEKVPDEQPSTEESKEEAERKYEMAEVRTALIEAKKKGFDAAGLIRSYGVENITAIPASKYNEIMDKLKGVQ